MLAAEVFRGLPRNVDAHQHGVCVLEATAPHAIKDHAENGDQAASRHKVVQRPPAGRRKTREIGARVDVDAEGADLVTVSCQERCVRAHERAPLIGGRINIGRVTSWHPGSTERFRHRGRLMGVELPDSGLV